MQIVKNTTILFDPLSREPPGTVDDRVRKKRLALPRLLELKCFPPQRAIKTRGRRTAVYFNFCIPTLCGVLRTLILAMAKVCNKIETGKRLGDFFWKKFEEWGKFEKCFS